MNLLWATKKSYYMVEALFPIKNIVLRDKFKFIYIAESLFSFFTFSEGYDRTSKLSF